MRYRRFSRHVRYLCTASFRFFAATKVPLELRPNFPWIGDPKKLFDRSYRTFLRTKDLDLEPFIPDSFFAIGQPHLEMMFGDVEMGQEQTDQNQVFAVQGIIVVIKKDAASGQDPQQREFVRFGIQGPQKFAELFGHKEPI